MTIQQDRQKHSIRHQHRRKIEPEGENRPRYPAKSIDNPKQVVRQPFHPNLQPAIPRNPFRQKHVDQTCRYQQSRKKRKRQVRQQKDSRKLPEIIQTKKVVPACADRVTVTHPHGVLKNGLCTFINACNRGWK